MAEKKTPTYSLDEIKALVLRGPPYRHLTKLCLIEAAKLKLDSDDIIQCVLSLTPEDFRKSMPADNEQAAAKGLWQDVYKPMFEGLRLYVKLQIGPTGLAVVINFKEK